MGLLCSQSFIGLAFEYVAKMLTYWAYDKMAVYVDNANRQTPWVCVITYGR